MAPLRTRLFLVLLGGLTPLLLGFDCPRPGIEERVAQAPVLLIGRALTATRLAGRDRRVTELRVLRLYRGLLLPGARVTLEDCVGPKCGPSHRRGRRLLLSATLLGGRLRDQGFCGLSRPLGEEGAAPDSPEAKLIELLEQLPLQRACLPAYRCGSCPLGCTQVDLPREPGGVSAVKGIAGVSCGLTHTLLSLAPRVGALFLVPTDPAEGLACARCSAARPDPEACLGKCEGCARPAPCRCKRSR